MPRPSLCPDCGHSTTAHTGNYCHNCGHELVASTAVAARQDRIAAGYAVASDERATDLRTVFSEDADVKNGTGLVLAVTGPSGQVATVKIAARADADGHVFVELAGIDCDLEGEQPGVYYPTPRETEAVAPTGFMVDDLQAVELDSLPVVEGITIAVDPDLDSMGFNRVAITGPTREAVTAYVREGWGDDDGDWFAEYVVARIVEVTR